MVKSSRGALETYVPMLEEGACVRAEVCDENTQMLLGSKSLFLRSSLALLPHAEHTMHNARREKPSKNLLPHALFGRGDT